MQSIDSITAREREASTEGLDLGELRSYLRGIGLAESSINVYTKWVISMGELVGKDPVLWTVEDQIELTKRWGEPSKGRKDGYAPRTKTLIKSALRHLWEQHQRYDLLHHAAFWRGGGRAGSRYDYVKAHTVPPEEVRAVLDTCRTTILDPRASPDDVMRHFMLFVIAGFGIRCIALHNLRLVDFRLDRDELHIYRTKGGKTRTVHMLTPVVDLWPRVMRARSKILDRFRDRFGEEPEVVARLDALEEPEGWLFFSRAKHKNNEVAEQLNRNSIHSTITTLTARITGKPWGPHSFRHAMVFRLHDDGWQPERIASFVGHENIQTTYEYVALGPAEHRKEAEKAEAARASRSGDSVVAPDRAAAGHLKALFEQGVLTKDEYLSKLESLVL